MNLRAPGTYCRRTWTPATRRACAGTRRSIRRTGRNPWRLKPHNRTPQVGQPLGCSTPGVTAPLPSPCPCPHATWLRRPSSTDAAITRIDPIAATVLLGLFVQKSRFMKQNEHVEKIGLYCFINPLHNGAMIYGYARVSTDGQSVEAQV